MTKTLIIILFSIFTIGCSENKVMVPPDEVPLVCRAKNTSDRFIVECIKVNSLRKSIR